MHGISGSPGSSWTPSLHACCKNLWSRWSEVSYSKVLRETLCVYTHTHTHTHTHNFFLVWGAHFLFCPFYEFQKFAGLCHFIREKVIALCRFWGMLLLILLTFFIHCHLQDFLYQNVVTVAQG